MVKLLRLFLKYGGYRVEEKIAGVVAPIGPYVRNLTIGVACMAAGVICVGMMLLFLGLSFFFALAGHAEWAYPALWTGLLVAGIAALVMGAGLSFLKRPYPAS